MTIPQIDLVAQYNVVKDQIDESLDQVLESGRYVLGPQVKALEQEVADCLGTRHAVGVASGTDALLLSLKALNVGPGDEVIIPAYTLFATAEAVIRAGAIPVFVDIDENTYCLDVKQVEARITGKTRAVIAVHLFGHPVEMAPLLDLAARHKLKVIEENSQAFGAEYRGRKTGSIGDAACLSFLFAKNLGGHGDGGMILTNDAEVAGHARMLRNHGWEDKYLPLGVGYNSRLDELQAVILRIKLRWVDVWNQQRCNLAGRYTRELSIPGIGVPEEGPGCKHVYNLYVIRTDDGDEVRRHLRRSGIGANIYCRLPIRLTAACSSYGYAEKHLPRAGAACRETLALPLYPEMTPETLTEVVDQLRELLG